MDGIRRTPTPATRRDGIGSARRSKHAWCRTARCGSAASPGQFGKHRVRVNSEYQHRCEGTPLKSGPRAATSAATTGSVSATTRRRRRCRRKPRQTAGRGYFDVPFYVNQGTWTMPASDQLLFEAGYTAFRYQPIFGHPAPDANTNLIPVTEQSNAVNARCTGTAATRRWRTTATAASSAGALRPARRMTSLTSAAYVTGANSIKFGYQFRQLDLLDKDVANSTQLGYRFNQGVPNAVSYYLPDFGRRTITKTHSFFLQDSWTRGRLDAAGRAALGPRLELRAVRTERHDEHVVPQSDSRSRSSARRAWMPTTTSRRASVSRMTSSAPAKRR